MGDNFDGYFVKNAIINPKHDGELSDKYMMGFEF